MAHDGTDPGREYPQESRKSKWYVARLIICCKVGENDDGPRTCDEQIRAIRAADAEQAYQKALRLGSEEEHSYKNVYGETVRWDFIGIANLEELSARSIRDGVEITSRLFEASDPAGLVNPRDDLTVFLAQRNKFRRADEIITEREADQG